MKQAPWLQKDWRELKQFLNMTVIISNPRLIIRLLNIKIKYHER